MELVAPILVVAAIGVVLAAYRRRKYPNRGDESYCD